MVFEQSTVVSTWVARSADSDVFLLDVLDRLDHGRVFGCTRQPSTKRVRRSVALRSGDPACIADLD